MFADEGNELLCRDQKCDCVNKTEHPQNDKTSQPIRIPAREKFFEKIVHAHEAGENVQRSTSNVQYRMRKLSYCRPIRSRMAPKRWIGAKRIPPSDPRPV